MCIRDSMNALQQKKRPYHIMFMPCSNWIKYGRFLQSIGSKNLAHKNIFPLFLTIGKDGNDAVECGEGRGIVKYPVGEELFSGSLCNGSYHRRFLLLSVTYYYNFVQ